jgi:hypothetical protein
MRNRTARTDQSITLTIPPLEMVKELLLWQKMRMVSSQPVHIVLVTEHGMEPLFRTYPEKALYTLAPGLRKLARQIDPLLNVLHVVKSSVSPRFLTAICDWLLKLCVADRHRLRPLALELVNGDIAEAVDLWRTFEYLNIKTGMDRVCVYLRSIFIRRPLRWQEFRTVLRYLPVCHTVVDTLLEEQTKHKIRNPQVGEHEAVAEWITAHHWGLRERLCDIRAAYDPAFGFEWARTKMPRYGCGDFWNGQSGWYEKKRDGRGC